MLVEEKEEGDGVGASGDGGAEAVARADVLGVEGEAVGGHLGRWYPWGRGRCAGLIYFVLHARVLYSSGGWDGDEDGFGHGGGNSEAVSVDWRSTGAGA